jgi:gas vesicle protein
VIRGEDHSGLNTGLAVLIGVGIGVGVGMLLAPASGEETRQKIQDSISGRRDPATGTYGM